MKPKLTERQTSRTQVAQPRKVDLAIYLRTYDLINSLDRAENKSWWQKASERFYRARPVKAGLVAAAGTGTQFLLPHGDIGQQEKVGSAAAPVLARGPVEKGTQQLALVRTSHGPVERQLQAQAAAAEPGSQGVSWVLLALLAVATAGLTFVIIRLAWHPVSAGPLLEHAKHAAVYTTTHLPARAHSPVS